MKYYSAATHTQKNIDESQTFCRDKEAISKE